METQHTTAKYSLWNLAIMLPILGINILCSFMLLQQLSKLKKRQNHLYLRIWVISLSSLLFSLASIALAIAMICGHKLIEEYEIVCLISAFITTASQSVIAYQDLYLQFQLLFKIFRLSKCECSKCFEINKKHSYSKKYSVECVLGWSFFFIFTIGPLFWPAILICYQAYSPSQSGLACYQKNSEIYFIWVQYLVPYILTLCLLIISCICFSLVDKIILSLKDGPCSWCCKKCTFSCTYGGMPLAAIWVFIGFPFSEILIWAGVRYQELLQTFGLPNESLYASCATQLILFDSIINYFLFNGYLKSLSPTKREALSQQEQVELYEYNKQPPISDQNNQSQAALESVNADARESLQQNLKDNQTAENHSHYTYGPIYLEDELWDYNNKKTNKYMFIDVIPYYKQREDKNCGQPENAAYLSTGTYMCLDQLRDNDQTKKKEIRNKLYEQIYQKKGLIFTMSSSEKRVTDWKSKNDDSKQNPKIKLLATVSQDCYAIQYYLKQVFDKFFHCELPTQGISKQKILEHLEEFLSQPKNDIAIFYYSGHGDAEGNLLLQKDQSQRKMNQPQLTLNNPKKSQEEDQSEISSGNDKSDMQLEPSGLLQTGNKHYPIQDANKSESQIKQLEEEPYEKLSFEEFFKLFEKSIHKPQELIIILDCCYSGFWVQKLRNYVKNYLGETQITIQASSRFFQKAQPIEKSQYSSFTGNLIKIFSRNTQEKIQQPCDYKAYKQIKDQFYRFKEDEEKPQQNQQTIEKEPQELTLFNQCLSEFEEEQKNQSPNEVSKNHPKQGNNQDEKHLTQYKKLNLLHKQQYETFEMFKNQSSKEQLENTKDQKEQWFGILFDRQDPCYYSTNKKRENALCLKYDSWEQMEEALQEL